MKVRVVRWPALYCNIIYNPIYPHIVFIIFKSSDAILRVYCIKVKFEVLKFWTHEVPFRYQRFYILIIYKIKLLYPPNQLLLCRVCTSQKSCPCRNEKTFPYKSEKLFNISYVFWSKQVTLQFLVMLRKLHSVGHCSIQTAPNTCLNHKLISITKQIWFL